MLRITPCQRTISDRFPVLSFVVRAPPERLFEIACAADPALFRPEERARRNADNFFTSRSAGLLRAPTGQATYLLPSEQLRRFAGRNRLYFAMASYSNARGDAADFSTHPSDAHRAPSVVISRDFTGKTLDRGRLTGKPVANRYGAPGAVLSWGGDLVAKAQEQGGAPAEDEEQAYDDGYPDEVWSERGGELGDNPEGEVDEDLTTEMDDTGSEEEPGNEGEDAYGNPRSKARRYGGPHDHYGEPAGFEDAPALSRALGRAVPKAQPSARAGSTGRYGTRLASGYEDAPALRAAAGAVTLLERPVYGTKQRKPRSDAGLPLTIRAKLEIMRPALEWMSGADRYGACRAVQGGPRGLEFGLALFPQRSGLLGAVLRAYQRRDPAGLRDALGPATDEVLAVTCAETEEERLAPIAGKPLWAREWVERLRALAHVTAFQAAQNEVAVEAIFDPALAVASRIGLTTDRGIGMVFDRFADMGEERASKLLLAAGQEVDTHSGEEALLDALVDASAGQPFERRVKALRVSPAFTDAAYQVV